MEQNIVILGAGYAGVLTAKKLAKRFRKQKDIKITLIDKNRYHTMLTELHEVAAHRVEEDSIKISLRRIFAGRKVELKLDTIASIDYDNKTLIGKESSYKVRLSCACCRPRSRLSLEYRALRSIRTSCGPMKTP